MRGTLVLGFLVAACNRTPPEPTPLASASEPVVTRSASASTTPPPNAGRCIAKLPATAPLVPPPAAATACPPDPEAGTKMPIGEVGFPEAPSAPPIQAELAKTPHDVEKGLMYRRTMTDQQGMLFKLEGRKDHTFWMHNTCIALDMLFVEEDGLVVGIVESAAPLTDSVRSVGCESSYVLEVNAGWTRKHGVAPGQKIALPSAIR